MDCSELPAAGEIAIGGYFQTSVLLALPLCMFTGSAKLLGLQRRLIFAVYVNLNSTRDQRIIGRRQLLASPTIHRGICGCCSRSHRGKQGCNGDDSRGPLCQLREIPDHFAHPFLRLRRYADTKRIRSPALGINYRANLLSRGLRASQVV